MSHKPNAPIVIGREEQPGLESLLSEQLYAYNCQATGVADGMMLSAALTDGAGRVTAGICGYTWGGVCEITHLWVQEALRGQGVGSALLAAAEREARARGCAQIVLMTHSFQAPVFYERRGFVRVAEISDYPPGHGKCLYRKALV